MKHSNHQEPGPELQGHRRQSGSPSHRPNTRSNHLPADVRTCTSTSMLLPSEQNNVDLRKRLVFKLVHKLSASNHGPTGSTLTTTVCMYGRALRSRCKKMSQTVQPNSGLRVWKRQHSQPEMQQERDLCWTRLLGLGCLVWWIPEDVTANFQRLECGLMVSKLVSRFAATRHSGTDAGLDTTLHKHSEPVIIQIIAVLID